MISNAVPTVSATAHGMRSTDALRASELCFSATLMRSNPEVVHQGPTAVRVVNTFIYESIFLFDLKMKDYFCALKETALYAICTLVLGLSGTPS